MSLIGKSIGNYQIKAKLGEGGMGTVYLGEHPLIGKRVAVKVLLEELSSKEDIVSRFFNEAKAVNDIGHQNIVDIVDFGKMKNDFGQDIVYFIMEFLDGESLAARLRRTGLTFKETMHVMQQCCSALAASHAKGIVHRDLKPENLYLCPRGGDKNFVKLLDFGIAKLTGDGGQSHKTRTGLVIGTPAYMSPEQCEGKGLIDLRSDVYSLGIMMYELLTGRVPFPGEGFGEILVAHLTKQPEPPSTINPDVTPQLEAIVMHAIEKDRNRRFQTMAEFQAAIENPDAHYQSWQGLPAPTASSSHSGGTMMLPEGGARTPTGQGNRPQHRAAQGADDADGPDADDAVGRGVRDVQRRRAEQEPCAAVRGHRRPRRHRRGRRRRRDGQEGRHHGGVDAARGGAEGRVGDRDGQERSARRQGHARRQRPERHDALGDQGQKGRRELRRARQARRLHAADAQHFDRQELRGAGAAREVGGARDAAAGAAGGQHAVARRQDGDAGGGRAGQGQAPPSLVVVVVEGQGRDGGQGAGAGQGQAGVKSGNKDEGGDDMKLLQPKF